MHTFSSCVLGAVLMVFGHQILREKKQHEMGMGESGEWLPGKSELIRIIVHVPSLILTVPSACGELRKSMCPLIVAPWERVRCYFHGATQKIQRACRIDTGATTF